MNFDIFCTLLNFLIEPGGQNSTVNQESLLFLPKSGTNGHYRADLNPSEGNGKTAIDSGFGSGTC